MNNKRQIPINKKRSYCNSNIKTKNCIKNHQYKIIFPNFLRIILLAKYKPKTNSHSLLIINKNLWLENIITKIKKVIQIKAELVNTVIAIHVKVSLYNKIIY